MIAAHHLGMDLGALHRRAQLSRHEYVVDSPSDVARPRIGEMTPPRIMSIALREQPKGIDEAGIHEILESGALLVRETLLAAIGFRVGQIEFGVRDIEVAAKNDRLGFFQLLAIGEKGRIPLFEAQTQAAQIILGVRRVDRHDIESVEFSRHDAALFGTVALQFVGEAEAPCEFSGKAVDDGQRSLLGKNSGAGISLLDGGIPVLMVVGQVYLELPALGLGLLQTQDVGPKLLEKRLEHSFFENRANTVDVPGKYLHSMSLVMVRRFINAARSPRRWLPLPSRRPGPCRPRSRRPRHRYGFATAAIPRSTRCAPHRALRENRSSRLRIACAPGRPPCRSQPPPGAAPRAASAIARR